MDMWEVRHLVSNTSFAVSHFQFLLNETSRQQERDNGEVASLRAHVSDMGAKLSLLERHVGTLSQAMSTATAAVTAHVGEVQAGMCSRYRC